MLGRIKALVIKEFRQIRRDVRTLLLIFVFPVFLLLLFGYALNFDVKHIKIAIMDNDKSQDSRNFAEVFKSTDYFNLVGYVYNEKEAGRILDEKIAQCVIVLPYNMSENMRSGKDVKIQFLVDGVDGNTATIIINYASIATQFYSAGFTKEALARTGSGAYIPIDAEPVFWYNPDLNTNRFLIPGLLAMILILTAVILTCLSIVREKELGSMEQLKVSPLGSLELIIGKVIPYSVVAMFVAVFTLLMAHIAFGIEIKGNVIMLFFSTVLFLLAALSIGIFVSTIANSQQVAFQLASLISMLPTFILSGFVFPIENMPWPIRILTNVTPAKFYIVILRSIMIKGVGIETYWKQVISLFIFSTVLLAIATLRTRRAKA